MGKTLLRSKKTSAAYFSIQNITQKKPVKQIYKKISKQEIVFFVQYSIYNLLILFHLLKLLKSLEKPEMNKPSVLVLDNFKKKYFLNKFPNENSFLKNNVLNNSTNIICLTILQNKIEPLEEISVRQSQTVLIEQSSLLPTSFYPFSLQSSQSLSSDEVSSQEFFDLPQEQINLPQKQGIFESCYQLYSRIKKQPCL